MIKRKRVAGGKERQRREKEKERERERDRETERKETDSPPVQCLFQSIHDFTGRVEHTVSTPDPELASTSGRVDATTDKVLSISPPADPGPSIITLRSSCNWLETTKYMYVYTRYSSVLNLQCYRISKHW